MFQNKLEIGTSASTARFSALLFASALVCVRYEPFPHVLVRSYGREKVADSIQFVSLKFDFVQYQNAIVLSPISSDNRADGILL